MEYQRVLAQLYEELASFTHGRVKVEENTELVGELDLDSLQLMNLLLFVEDRFDISIPVSILPDVKTVRDLAIQVVKLTNTSEQ
ncbi:acyl carrier protein [Ferrigenium sp. UT5]|uniref:acyl carrier protein n=1 Tax=Ferrigenium sp. UT5 TaxID=3242105 RepID=UPI0035516766